MKQSIKCARTECTEIHSDTMFLKNVILLKKIFGMPQRRQKMSITEMFTLCGDRCYVITALAKEVMLSVEFVCLSLCKQHY